MASNRGIEALVEQWDPVLRRAFLAAIADIQDRVQVSLVAQLLERGDVFGAIEAVGLDPVAFRLLDAAIAQAFEAGGSDTADRIPALRQPSGHRLQVRFDVRNPRAETWLREHSSTLVTEIIADQRQAIRQHLTAGMEAGQNPRIVALDLVGRVNPASGHREGGVIGLTAAQEEWCRRYAAELASGDRAALTRALRDRRFDRTVEKALREGAPIPADMRAKMVQAYRNRALKYRADVIGRTEAMRALHRSQIESYEQAIGLGQVDEATVEKVWRSSSDRRVRDTHRALHGRAVGFRADFVAPSGARLQYPGDPDAPASETVQCRCWMSVRIDHLAAAVAAERGAPVTAAPVTAAPASPAPPPPPLPEPVALPVAAPAAKKLKLTAEEKAAKAAEKEQAKQAKAAAKAAAQAVKQAEAEAKAFAKLQAAAAKAAAKEAAAKAKAEAKAAKEAAAKAKAEQKAVEAKAKAEAKAAAEAAKLASLPPAGAHGGNFSQAIGYEGRFVETFGFSSQLVGSGTPLPAGAGKAVQSVRKTIEGWFRTWKRTGKLPTQAEIGALSAKIHPPLPGARDPALGHVRTGVTKVMEAPRTTAHWSPVSASEAEAEQLRQIKAANLGPAERDAQDRYKGSLYDSWNAALRKAGGDIDQVHGTLRTLTERLDAAIARHALPTDLLLHRGARFDSQFPTVASAIAQKGFTYRNPAYLSTSTQFEVARNFAWAAARPPAPRVVFTIRVKKGDPALVGTNYESEYIFPRGKEWRILDVEQVADDTVHVLLEPL